MGADKETRAAADNASSVLRAQLPPGRVVTGPEQVFAATRMWNAQVTEYPLVVVRCRTSADVQAAVRAARSAGIPLSVLAGRHDWAGTAIHSGKLVVDLGLMRKVSIAGGEARVAGGATVSDVLDAARPQGLAAAAGTVGSVGFAGLTLGGGYGTLVGVAGLGIDSMLSATVVLADGRLVTAGPAREPELFWALRGGGGNFGIVTEIRTRLHPHAEVTTGTIAFGLKEAHSVLRRWRDLTASADDALDVMFGALTTPGGPVVFTAPTWSGDVDDADAQVDRVRGLGRPVLDDVGQRALADVVHALDDVFPHGGNYRLSARILPRLTDAAIDAFVQSAEAMPASCSLNVHHAHGAATRVPVAETAYAYRDEHLVVEILGAWPSGDGGAESTWVTDTERRLDPHALPGGWANLMAHGDQRAGDAYGPNTGRLLAAKERYDPDVMFSASPLPR